MHSNGVNGHSDDPASVPLPPALTQQVEPRGDDGGSLPLEPFRFTRVAQHVVDLPAQIVDMPAEAPPAAPEPEPIFELTLAPELEAVAPVADEAEAAEADMEEAVSVVQELIVQEPELQDLAGPARDLAERFEKLSRRLRAEDVESLLPSLAQGDRFDALVAGFLAGYISAKDA